MEASRTNNRMIAKMLLESGADTELVMEVGTRNLVHITPYYTGYKPGT